MKTVNYLRVSTLQQDVERQQDQINKFNDYKNNKVVATFEEKESGTKDNRIQLKLMLDYCGNPENGVEQVVVDELSRLGRTKYVLDVIDKLTILKINLHSIKENVNTLNADGTKSANATLLTGILSSLSGYELETIRYRMTSGKKTSVKNGNHWGGGKLPYGYKKDGKRLVIDANEASIYMGMVDDFIGGMTFHMIAHNHNKNSILTKMGKNWQDAQVNTILKSPIYKGYITFKEELIYQPHLEIISPEKWDKLQYEIKNRTRTSNHHKYNYKLRQGVIVCGICGKSYGPFNADRNYLYKCLGKYTKTPGIGGGCHNRGIGIDKLTNSVEKIIIKYFTSDLIKNIDYTDVDNKIDSVQKELDNLNDDVLRWEKMESRLLDTYIVNPTITPEIFTQKLSEIQNGKEKSKNNISIYKSKLDELITIRHQMGDLQSFARDIRQNGLNSELLNGIVSKITIHPSDRKLTHRKNDLAVKVVVQVADKELAFHTSPFSKGYELDKPQPAIWL